MKAFHMPLAVMAGLVLAAIFYLGPKTEARNEASSRVRGKEQSSAAVDRFAQAFGDATLLRLEPEVDFVPGLGEPSFPAYTAKKPDERLVRRSGLYQLSRGPELQRLDRIYRLKIGDDEANRKSAPQDTPLGVQILDQGGGELVWSNAMAANRLIVTMKPGVNPAQLLGRLPKYPALVASLDRDVYTLTSLSRDLPRLEEWVAACQACAEEVDYAETDPCVTALAVPRNCCYDGNVNNTAKQWHLPKINAAAGWGYGTSTLQSDGKWAAIAVLDTGIKATHPSFAGMLLPGKSYLPGETSTNANNDNNGHGTQVAGVIGAAENTFGVVGVAWKTKILPLRVMGDANGISLGNASHVEAALVDLRDNLQATNNVVVANHAWGLQVWNLSLYNTMMYSNYITATQPSGVTGTFSAGSNVVTLTGDSAEIAKIKVGMKLSETGISAHPMVMWVDAVNRKFGMVLPAGLIVPAAHTLAFDPKRASPVKYKILNVIAAGNDNKDMDTNPAFPACFLGSFNVTVGASDTADNRNIGTYNSNHGLHTAQFFAPGMQIVTTNHVINTGPDGTCCGTASTTDMSKSGYILREGTSFSAGLVSGAAALYRAKNPSIAEDLVAARLCIRATPAGNLGANCTTGGRLDLLNFLKP